MAIGNCRSILLFDFSVLSIEDRKTPEKKNEI
jgi:hypothetical protein